jgi:hypothetical protein
MEKNISSKITKEEFTDYLKNQREIFSSAIKIFI